MDEVIKLDLGLTPFQKIKELPEEWNWLADFNSIHSRKGYALAVQQFLQFLGIGFEELRTIDSSHVIAFKQFLIAQGKSNRTVNNRISALSSLFTHLLDKQMVAFNPCAGLKRLRVEESEVVSKVLAPEEARAMLEAPLQFNDNRKQGQHPISYLQSLRDRAILHILFFRGCRINELGGLTCRNYFKEQGFSKIEVKLKGGKMSRLAINQELVAALDQYLEASGHRENKDLPLILPIKTRPGEKRTRRLSVVQLEFVWKKYQDFVGLEGTTPHSARATFATNAIENGAPIEVVQTALGHSQIRTTQMYIKRVISDRESASFRVSY